MPRRGAKRSGHRGGGGGGGGRSRSSLPSTTATSGNPDSDARAPVHSAAPTGRKPPLTHFLCIPLVTEATRPQLEASMARFRREVLGGEEGHGEEKGEQDQRKTSTTQPVDDAEKSKHDATERSNGDDASKALEDDDDDNTTRATAATPTAPFSPSAIRPVGTLHLTLGVMSLRDDEAIARALALLRSLDLPSLLRQSQSQSQSQPQSQLSPPSEANTTSPNPPLTLSLQGLHPMHSPSRTSILYAAPHDPTDRLLRFATAVRDAFAAAALLVPDDRALRLHATLVNTVYDREGRRRGGGGGGDGSGQRGGKRRGRDRAKFDARDLMQRFNGVVWAEGVRVPGVAVCEMGARDLGHGRGVGYREVAAVGF